MSEIKLLIGYEPDFVPLTLRVGNEARGLVIDVVVEALGRIGVAVDFAPVLLPEHDVAIQTGKIDAVAFKAIIPEREGAYDFSRPIATSGAAWFVLPAGWFEGNGPASGSRLATPTKGPLISHLRQRFPDVGVVGVETYADALNAVISGEADCAALNFHVGCYLANRDHAGRFILPVTPFQSLPIGLALAKGLHPGMLDKFDRALEEMRAAGQVAAIEQRWLVY